MERQKAMWAMQKAAENLIEKGVGVWTVKESKSKDISIPEDGPVHRPVGFRAIAAALSVRRPPASPREEAEIPSPAGFLPSGFHSPPDD
ncbi:hypothetical protein [Rhizobium ruizarguesonis]|uniref:hypothetical protein n=1 Tax=Rhizobium ruizarguesonis TaxID=2081791 RepID=UPI0010324686|nr:hypothetical protein [Rhizobium ruizarguesonis]TAT84827.1 hypothetical protein ELI52_15645 [Rhizobium ruizarguesonis]